MSVSLQEIFEGSGYDFSDYDDLQKVRGMLYESEELAEEVDAQIDHLENLERDRQEAEEDIAIMDALGK